MENKWSFVLLMQPVAGLLLILIAIYTFTVGSPHLLPWAFVLMGPLFLAMGIYEMKRQSKNPSIFYFCLAAISLLFALFSFTAF
ncbi:DUF3953 domain-containing protein [Ureibacillus sp. Re31]|uniref:DUF3953 domain-containing protein n=1 Tax=Ureibacillus galli TaxID=2762222 RepID=A0ABR8X8V7_9BACL|nr:DUF3953 domain-containing protein [Ureibacillus galli]MBD8025612.1 DUF3953 domain-containing protein [Ureibacillus galli]